MKKKSQELTDEEIREILDQCQNKNKEEIREILRTRKGKMLVHELAKAMFPKK